MIGISQSRRHPSFSFSSVPQERQLSTLTNAKLKKRTTNSNRCSTKWPKMEEAKVDMDP